jgi:3-deoxy-D-manno-octulosonic-acid transferase
LGSILYQLFLFFYSTAIKIAALFNSKAKLWVAGRSNIFKLIQAGLLSKPVGNSKLVWMHCASLGEFEQGRPLLEKLRDQYPSIKICLTFFSPSGYEVRKNYSGADYVFYLPMDGRKNAREFIDAINPSLVLWVKYEFWYYYLQTLKERGIPVLMVSGIFRKSQPFFRWYGGFWKKMLSCFSYFFLQNEQSKELLSSIGIGHLAAVSGDTRFDRVIEIAGNFEPIPLIERFCGNSKVIVAGSTWDDDEAELVHYAKANPHIRFIIAPHEIEENNIKEVKRQFIGSVLFSELAFREEWAASQPLINILIIDNIGMLSRLYHYADITFVGGGFNAGGIHNVLEAAVYGKPVIFGPEYEKFAEAVDLVFIGAGIVIENALQLETAISSLWENESLLKEKSDAARQYVYENAGATQKILNYVAEKRLLTN